MPRYHDDLPCPSCGVRPRVRLAADEVCPDCRSAEAWGEYVSPGARLVIDGRSIAESEARRAGEDAGVPAWRRAAGLAPAAVAVAVSLCAVLTLPALFAARPVGPIRQTIDAWSLDARRSTLLGLVATLVGAGAVVAFRRSRFFRSWPAAVAAWGSAATGLLVVSVGAFHWVVVGPSGGMQHLEPPPIAASPAAAFADRIMRATVVVVAPAADGDARWSSVGAGAVVRTEARRAWIVTCSHVAMPGAAMGTVRDPASAPAVWVHLADGRSAPGTVRWTAPPPLDVAVVSVDLDGPPPPVDVAPAEEDVGAGAEVAFVPNPLRRGWLHHRGNVLRREVHKTPAGEFSLIFTDLPVQPGDSGTGLFDARGRLVGINTWRGEADARPVGICLPAVALVGGLDAAAAGAPAPVAAEVPR